jgi:hypothetical protein
MKKDDDDKKKKGRAQKSLIFIYLNPSSEDIMLGSIFRLLKATFLGLGRIYF